jgi:hypothetical protein
VNRDFALEVDLNGRFHRETLNERTGIRYIARRPSFLT